MSTQVLELAGTQLDCLPRLSEYLRRRATEGVRFVVVHGGGRELSRYRQQIGLDDRPMLELRATEPQQMELTTMVQCGLVNKRLVSHLTTRGHRAVGVCGADFGLMHAALINETQLGRVGGPPRVDPAPMRWLLSAGYVVVVAPVCIGEDGELVRVNADTVAQSIAVALGATALEFADDTDAVRSSTGPIGQLSASEVDRLVASPDVRGRMVPKLHATTAALEGGVGCVRIGNLESLTHGDATTVRP